MSSMKELHALAKGRGINTFQMSKAGIEAALADLDAAGEPSDSGRNAERAAGREDTGRRTRVPLGAMRQKLGYPKREGYVRRWFNDAGNRIHDADMAGYTPVEGRSDGRMVKVSRRVGTNDDGSPLVAHLMEIRQEFYDEDQAIKQVVVDDIDAAIMGGKPDGQGVEVEKFYTPTEGISMKVET